MLPLVQRELRVGARLPTLHRNRLRFGIVVVLVGAAMVVFANPNHPVKSGGVFTFFSVISMLLCLLEGPRKTADAISEEKRAGTLGFLFLTDLRGWDIVLGKMMGAMVRSFSALLAFVPILAVTLLVGGTTLGDFWRTVLALVAAMFLSLSLSLFISALSRERSLTVSVGCLLFLLIVPWITGMILNQGLGRAEWQWLVVASPMALMVQGWESYYIAGPKLYWGGVAGYFAASLVLLVAASIALPHVWQEKPRKTEVTISRRRARAEAKRRSRQLDQNPILWVAYHPGQARSFRIIFLAIVVGCVGFRLFLMDAGWEPEIADLVALVSLTLLLNVYIASQASMNLAEARRSGALELLLSTPLKVTDIVRGQILALKEMFLLPALGLIALYGWLIADYLVLNPSMGEGFFMLMHLLHLVLGICAIAAVGMWMGMTSKTPNRALFKALFIGMVLPYIICIPTFLVQLVLTALAKDRLMKNFRRYVAEKYLQAPSFRLAPVPSGDPHVPPVIR